MERLFTPGIIYKLIKYTDSSAIAMAFTPEYGKIKLFIPKAFTNKNGILALVPGEIDFLKKDNSDLNKMYSFRHDPAFFSYVENPSISVRLSLAFDVIDNMYGVEQKEPVLWTLIKKFNPQNASAVLVYTVYAILKNSGLMFEFEKCPLCGKETEGTGYLSNGLFYCAECAPADSVKAGDSAGFILKALGRKELYKRVILTRKQEFDALDLFVNHIETSTGKKLKSYKAYRDLVSAL